MKKIISVFIIVILLCSFVSCDKQSKNNNYDINNSEKNVVTKNNTNNSEDSLKNETTSQETPNSEDSSKNETTSQETQDDKKYIKIAVFESQNDVFLNIGQSVSVNIDFSPVDVDDYNGAISFSSQGIATATYKTDIIPINSKPYGKIKITGVREGETTLTVTYPGGASCSIKIIVKDLDKYVKINTPSLPLEVTYEKLYISYDTILETVSSIQNITVNKELISDSKAKIVITIDYKCISEHSGSTTAGFNIHFDDKAEGDDFIRESVENVTVQGRAESYTCEFSIDTIGKENREITLRITDLFSIK